jgi:predicted secreted protein
MKFTSVLAIYVLFWALSLFLVLPFRLRNAEPEDEPVRGQADSAPPNFSVKRTAFWTTIVATVLCALYYVNYVNGWVRPEFLDLFTPR